MKRLMLLAVGLLAFSGMAKADDVEIRGVGAASCGEFLTAEKNGGTDKYGYHQWAQGWMTGVNFMLAVRDKEAVYIPDPDAMTQYLVNYCTTNPLNKFQAAVSDLMIEVMKNKHPRDLSGKSGK